MNRLQYRIKQVLTQNEKILCCVLPLGDPDFQTSKRLVALYLESGVDIVELMIPSQNPYFDSSQLQDSCQRSLKNNTDYEAYMNLIEEIRQTYPDEPFEVMTYSDVVKAMGVEPFVNGLKEADIEAHLLADSIVTKEWLLNDLDNHLEDASITRIRFMPYPFREDLLPDIVKNGRDFMILQSMADKDGRRPTVAPGNRELISRLRSSGTQAAILLGYGIRDPERVREAVDLDPDGVIIGSVMMERIAAQDFKGLAELILGLKNATK